jgi:integrase
MRLFKRNGYWYVDIRGYGVKRQKIKLSSWKKVAQEIADEIEAKIVRQEWLGTVNSKTTFKEFSQKYLSTYASTSLRPPSYNRYQDIVNRILLPFFGEKKLSEIRPEDVEAFRAERLKKVSPSTVNREFTRLRSIFYKAVQWGYLRHYPFKSIKEFNEPPGKVRFITPEEFEKLLWACDPNSLLENPNNWGRTFSKLLCAFLKPAVLLAFHTGMRMGEILKLKWKDIDLKNRIISVETTKNNERRTIPINKTLHESLKSLLVHLGTDNLFPNISSQQLSNAFTRACKRAGIKDFRFHDLRHSFASYLTMGQQNLRTVQTLLGHKDLRMTMRYSHLSDQTLKEAVSLLEGFPNSLIGVADRKHEDENRFPLSSPDISKTVILDTSHQNEGANLSI